MNHTVKLALACTAILTHALARAGDLTVIVDDVKAAEGNLMIAVYNSSDTFLKTPSNATGTPAKTSDNKFVFKNLPEGDYAFAVYHDANSNGKMDKNLVGIPTEDYGFSNNAMGKMGPPRFDDAKFTVPAAGATVRVSLK
ncbi:MAG: DUF2141 domain-containing protein [Massilia sp.]